jgi:hypothetical protein
LSGPAQAGAWPIDPGQTQLIAKYEQSGAQKAFDDSGLVVAIPKQSYQTLDVFVEHGWSKTLTLQGNLRQILGQETLGYRSTRTTADLGLRWTPYQKGRWVISLYAGGAVLAAKDKAQLVMSDSRSANLEARVLVGREITVLHHRGFAEVQLAQLSHSGQLNEERVETRVGLDMTKNWQIFAQTFAGTRTHQSNWSKAELSLVRKIGPVRLQAGWRQSVSGQSTAVESGPVLAVWYRF